MSGKGRPSRREDGNSGAILASGGRETRTPPMIEARREVACIAGNTHGFEHDGERIAGEFFLG